MTRKAIFQFDPAVPYGLYGLEQVHLVSESGSELDHARRASALARTLPANAVVAINAEYYPDNVAAACRIIAEVKRANPRVQRTAYVPKLTIPIGCAVGWDSINRRAAVTDAVTAAKRLRDAGATLVSVDGYARLSPSGDGVKQYLADSPFGTWCDQVGQAAAVLEAVLPPLVWTSNRFLANGVPIATNKPEPPVAAWDFMKMNLFCEHRGWQVVNLMGWSDSLKKNTGKGFFQADEHDIKCLELLLDTAKPTT